MEYKYLYRGVNANLHKDTEGILLPKLMGEPFVREVFFGEKVYFGGGAVFGKSEQNAIVMHQQDSSEYKTSGVSTTPNYENAVKYATHNGKYESGVVYKVDASLLDKLEVKAYKVSEHAVKPAIPEDEEIILVAKDNAALPSEIIVEVIVI